MCRFPFLKVVEKNKVKSFGVLEERVVFSQNQNVGGIGRLHIERVPIKVKVLPGFSSVLA